MKFIYMFHKQNICIINKVCRHAVPKMDGRPVAKCD